MLAIATLHLQLQQATERLENVQKAFESQRSETKRVNEESKQRWEEVTRLNQDLTIIHEQYEQNVNLLQRMKVESTEMEQEFNRLCGAMEVLAGLFSMTIGEFFKVGADKIERTDSSIKRAIEEKFWSTKIQHLMKEVVSTGEEFNREKFSKHARNYEENALAAQLEDEETSLAMMQVYLATLDAKNKALMDMSSTNTPFQYLSMYPLSQPSTANISYSKAAESSGGNANAYPGSRPQSTGYQNVSNHSSGSQGFPLGLQSYTKNRTSHLQQTGPNKTESRGILPLSPTTVSNNLKSPTNMSMDISSGNAPCSSESGTFRGQQPQQRVEMHTVTHVVTQELIRSEIPFTTGMNDLSSQRAGRYAPYTSPGSEEIPWYQLTKRRKVITDAYQQGVALDTTQSRSGTAMSQSPDNSDDYIANMNVDESASEPKSHFKQGFRSGLELLILTKI